MSRLDSLLALLQENDNDPFILFGLAKEYETSGEDAIALDYYIRLKEVQPDYIGLYYHLAKLYERRDEMAKAFEIYDAGIAIAKKLGDQHSLSELKNARTNLTFEM